MMLTKEKHIKKLYRCRKQGEKFSKFPLVRSIRSVAKLVLFSTGW